MAESAGLRYGIVDLRRSAVAEVQLVDPAHEAPVVPLPGFRQSGWCAAVVPVQAVDRVVQEEVEVDSLPVGVEDQDSALRAASSTRRS